MTVTWTEVYYGKEVTREITFPDEKRADEFCNALADARFVTKVSFRKRSNYVR